MSRGEEIWKKIDQAIFILGFLFLAVPAVFFPQTDMFNLGTLSMIVGMMGLASLHNDGPGFAS